jgi:hypothetical protein
MRNIYFEDRHHVISKLVVGISSLCFIFSATFDFLFSGWERHSWELFTVCSGAFFATLCYCFYRFTTTASEKPFLKYVMASILLIGLIAYDVMTVVYPLLAEKDWPFLMLAGLVAGSALILSAVVILPIYGFSILVRLALEDWQRKHEERTLQNRA